MVAVPTPIRPRQFARGVSPIQCPKKWSCRPGHFWVISLLLLSALGSACSVADNSNKEKRSSDEDAGATASVILGTGESQFEMWLGEPTLGLSAGVQGGSHIWVSFVATGMLPYGPNDNLLGLKLSTQVEGQDDSLLSFEADLATRVYDANPEQDSSRPPSAALDLSRRSFAGYPAQIANAGCAHGKRILVKLTLTDARGLTAATERAARLEVRENNRQQACE